MFRKTALAVLATLPALAFGPAAGADPLVIPASAHADGSFGSHWVTDLSLHNAGTVAVPLSIRYVPEAGAASRSVTLTVPARGTRRESDLLGTSFGLTSGSGALVLDVDAATLRKLAISSRTYNVATTGTFGQEVPAAGTESFLGAGDRAVLFTPSDTANSRLNGGVYALEAGTATFRLLGDTGTVLAEKADVPFTADSATRYNDLVRTLFGDVASGGAAVEIEATSGRIVAWGSRVDNRTNDGDFALARKVRSNELPSFVGLDTGADGSADLFDRDGDFVLDDALSLSTSAIGPYELRLLASDPEGRPLTWSAVSLPQSATLDPATGILRIWASGSLGGGTTLRVRISDGTDSIVVSVKVGTY